MKSFFLLFICLQSVHAISNQVWTHVHGENSHDTKRLIDILSRSKTGKKLIQQAKEKAAQTGRTLLDVIKPGQGSLTDTTLLRRFSSRSPSSVVYEQKSTVFIDKESRTYDAILDLAHELTHFAFRENFNPYRKNFSIQEFISSTIEGKGGEVDAYIMECQVLLELFSAKVAKRYQCNEIIDKATHSISRKLTIQKFYQVGELYTKFSDLLEKQSLRESFPLLGKAGAVFISSAYGLPYPVAAYYEYRSVLEKACDNDKRRMVYFEKNKRSPASLAGSYQTLQVDYNKRCKELPLSLNLF